MFPKVLVNYAERVLNEKIHEIPIVDKGFTGFYSALLHKISNAGQTVVVCPEFSDLELFTEAFNFYLKDVEIWPFPNYEVLPYDEISPEFTTVSRRIETLLSILSGKPGIVVTTARSFFRYLPPPEKISQLTFTLTLNQEISRDALAQRMVEFSYRKVDVVEEMGEFCFRGDIMDVYPFNSDEPVRIGFFDDLIEEMRVYDPETQRSVKDCDTLTLYAGHEVVFGKEEQARLKDFMLSNRSKFDTDYFRTLDRSIMENNLFSGIEALMPILEERVSRLTDFFPKKPLLIFTDKEEILGALKAFHEENLQEVNHQLNLGRIVIDPDKHYMLPDKAIEKIDKERFIGFTSQPVSESGPLGWDYTILSNLTLNVEKSPLKNQLSYKGVMAGFASIVNTGINALIAVRNNSAAESVTRIIESEERIVKSEHPDVSPLQQIIDGEDDGCIIFHGNLNHGFRIKNKDGKTVFCLVTHDELFGADHVKRSKRRKFKNVLSSLNDIAVNDLIVHEDYGVGVYLGLQSRSYGDLTGDFIVIEYRDGDKVFVPVDDAYRISKYASVGDIAPKVNSLKDKSWEKVKSKAVGKIHEMAEELVKIYAARKAKKGITFSSSQPMLNDFELAFPYNETEDQLTAIKEVYEDMESESSMDRLICGDVGFGKTEVAMRAACKAALDGYQVAVLVPTTVLARQHGISFKERFLGTPMNIGVLSRLIGQKETKETLEELKKGAIDILVGTHRIISKDVKFKNLGLLIIDEEQRFGVKHKEQIRQLRTEVDTLSLSATPIPRTMQLSLSGIRDISLITTPPMDRRSIKTRVLRYNSRVITEAVQREIARSGQAYFVHNKVMDIEELKLELSRLMPRVNIGVAHGQMAPKELEDVMMSFQDGKHQILLCTTIIESGLDIPNANTIIINNSDRFGLAQLYQLRGRVGRSKRQSFAYLLNKGEENINEHAVKRLKVMRELTELGSGFKISSYDLALRGAGNMLGKEQSGHIEGVGINLYMSMVEDEVERIRNGENSCGLSAKNEERVIITDFEKVLPTDYIENSNLRLKFYREISNCKTFEELDEYRKKILDMYGLLPETVEELFSHLRLKVFALLNGIHTIKVNPTYISLKFDEGFEPDHQKLISTMKTRKIAIRPDNTLNIFQELHNGKQCIAFIDNFLQEILPNENRI